MQPPIICAKPKLLTTCLWDIPFRVLSPHINMPNTLRFNFFVPLTDPSVIYLVRPWFQHVQVTLRKIHSSRFAATPAVLCINLLYKPGTVVNHAQWKPILTYALQQTRDEYVPLC